jgi:hypothetical protein
MAASSQAPTHTNGTVTGDDGIPWRYIQPGDVYQTHVYNVTFENCTFEKSGNIIANWITPDWHYENYPIHRTSYPGTEQNTMVWGITISKCRLVGKGPQVLVNVMGNMKEVIINGCYFNNPRCTVMNVDESSAIDELIASINGCTFVDMQPTHDGSDNPPTDYQNCPILLRDIQDSGKFAVIHNGGKLICSGAGNSFRGSTFECSVSNDSHLRFSQMDLPLNDLHQLTPEIGDICRSIDGLYVNKAAGWARLS